MKSRSPSKWMFLAALCATYAAAQGLAPAGQDHSAIGGRVLPLPRDLEIRLAVNALPKQLRAGATVLVMESSGYLEARHGNVGHNPGRLDRPA